jgi:hypothetical protein
LQRRYEIMTVEEGDLVEVTDHLEILRELAQVLEVGDLVEVWLVGRMKKARFNHRLLKFISRPS